MIRPQYGFVAKLSNKVTLRKFFICDDFLFKPSQLMEIVNPRQRSTATPQIHI